MTNVISVICERQERERFCDFLAKAEGRDKFGKTVQFFTRFLSGVFRDVLGYTDLGKTFELFWRAMLDGRRMQWFGKSLMEFKTVQQTLENEGLSTEIRYTHAFARMCFLMRWAVENVMILVKLNVLKLDVRWQDLNRIAKRFWMGAVVAGVVTEVLKIKKIQETKKEFSADAKQKDMMKCVQTAVTHLADAPGPMAIGFDIPLSDTLIGASHTVAACLQSYNLYPASK